MTLRSPFHALSGLAAAALLWVGAAPGASQDRPGYDDTPVIPGQPWKVHDKARPHPGVVTPGAGAGQAPADAVVLFDGSSLDAFTGRGGEAKWDLVDGAMVVNGTGDLQTRQSFGDCQIHLEWSSPGEVKGSSQGRGNSGVYLMGKYEIQVLDTYQNPSYPDGQAAAMYGQWPPLVNACRGPGEWQSYDIVFEGPRFAEDGALRRPARVTVIHNGVLVHHAKEFMGGTSHRAVAKYSKHPTTGPIKLQDHGNPVRYRNFWVRPLGDYDRPE